MRSKVHPKYKTKYRVGNWSAYEQALVQRGDVTLWLSADATDAWRPSPSGRPGAPKKFSDCAIETALTLRLVFRVPLRQAEGFLRSVLSLMGVDLAAPDHTTLSRRSQSLAVAFRRIPSRGPIHLIVDSTGRSIVGEGEWAAVQHGGRGHRGWKTRHLAVDRGGVIVAHALTEPTVDAATIGIDLIETVDDEIARVTADAAYDTVAFYEAAEMRDATVVGSTVQDREGVSASAAVARARSHDHGREDARPAPLEAGGRLPAPGAGGECVLSVQIDSRGSASRPVPRRASGRVRGAGRRHGRDRASDGASTPSHGHVDLLRGSYNFIRPHRALKFGRETRTPAMQAGLVSPMNWSDIFTAPAALYAFHVAVVRVPVAVQLMHTSPAALSSFSWPHEHRSAA